MTTQQYDNSRSGVQSLETVLTPANVSATTFGKVFTLPVLGHVYAQPLYISGLTMADGALHNVLFIATEQDFVYAFDADGNNPAAGYLWRVSLAGAGETTVTSRDVGSGDISPDIGVTGTPVIDASSNTLYVVAKSKTATLPAVFYQRLHALNLLDGTEKFNGPTNIHGTVPGTGDGGTTVVFNPLLGNQRAGLLLAPTPNGTSPASVFIAWASHGDNGPYHGWVMSYSASDISLQTGVWCDTPNGMQGGIWLAGGALSSDNAGTIFGAAGNGTFDAGESGSDFGDSAFALSLTGSVLAPRSFFTPSVQAQLNIHDNDMGVSSVVLLPKQTGTLAHLAINADKSGNIYLLNADALGGYDSASDASVETIHSGGYSIRTSASFFNNTLYLAPEGAPLSAWSFDPLKEILSTTPVSSTKSTFGCSNCGGAGSTPTLSANGVTNAIAWTLDNSGREKTPGILHAYDATNLQTELYNSAQAAKNRDAAFIAVKFTTPVVANGRVYVGGVNGVTAYGPIQPVSTVTLTALPASVVAGASSTLTVAASNAASVVITGTDGSSTTLGPNVTSLVVTPASTTTYTATATSGTTTVTATATVAVLPPLKVSITATPAAILAGSNSTLSVMASGATQLLLAGSDGSRYVLPTAGGSQVVTPLLTTTYTVTATAGSSTLSSSATVSVTPVSASCSTTTPGVVICAPGSGAKVASPLLLSAAAMASAGNIGAVRAYLDNVAILTLANPSATRSFQINQPISAVAGLHRLVVVGYQSNGGFVQSAQTFLVSGPVATGCAATADTVNICSPASGAHIASPTVVSAGAATTKSYITAARIYVDGHPQAFVVNPQPTQKFALTQPVTLTKGSHYLVVVAYLSGGAALSKGETVVVP